MTDERWLPIPDHPDYEASSWGRIRNRRLGHLLHGTITRDGYVQVSVRGPRGRKVAYAHRLICSAFHGPAPAGFVCDHVSGSKTDNRPENLEWVTPAVNVRRAAALGLLRCGRLPGELHPNAKLTDAIVTLMRARRRAGERLAALAEEYGVTTQAAHMAVTRRTWRHLPDSDESSRVTTQ